METETRLAFKGTDEEQKIAAHAFEAMKRKGMLFGANAPIRMNAEGIAKALTKAGGAMSGSKPEDLVPKIEKALSKNGGIFARADNGEFVTTKSGRAPQIDSSANVHTFKERLNTEAVTLDAEAAREYADSLVSRAAARAEKTSVMENIIGMQPVAPTPVVPHQLPHAPHITFDTAHTTVIPQHLAPPVPALEPRHVEEPLIQPERPAAEAAAAPAPAAPATPTAPAAKPAAPPEKEAEAAPAPAPQPVEAAAPAPATSQAVVEAPVEEAAPPPVEAPPAPAPAPQPAAAAPAPAQAAAPAPPVKPAPPVEKKEPVVTGPIEMRVMTADGPVTIDLREQVDDILADAAVAAALTELMSAGVEEDSRLVRFGSDIFPEEAIERFSKGDFRRIKEFLEEPETGGVASDRDILDYVLGRRQEHPDYERIRFSLNLRLYREKKDFEFVGIDTNRLWMNAGTVPVTLPKRKPAEIGQDYRYLEDPATVSVEEEEAGIESPEPGPIDYSLTYYEYENGVLPYDRRLKRLIPGALMEDQRAALVQFEVPQLYMSVLAELRYPTGNRGGFLMGLADFFEEHMVPGARFTILPTDRADNIFELQFVRPKEEEANLPSYDDRRGRYQFRPVSFAVGTDPTMLLTQERFGKLHNHKKLEEAERRRPDTVITNAFEIAGEEMDGKLWAILDDIYAVVNIERPMSKSWLKTLLSGAYPFFYADENTEGAYFYDESKRPS